MNNKELKLEIERLKKLKKEKEERKQLEQEIKDLKSKGLVKKAFKKLGNELNKWEFK